MAVLQKFRSAVGGFNRRDVLNYIESAESAYQAKLRRQSEELKAAEEGRLALEQELSRIRDAHGTASAEEARVRASLEEATHTLSRVRGELSQAETKLAVARTELKRLQSQVAELEPMAKNYEELKERVAVVELDAHRKAQATLDEAGEQARAIREETCRWLEDVLGEYSRLRSSVDEQIRAVNRAAESMTDSDGAVARLRELSGTR